MKGLACACALLLALLVPEVAQANSLIPSGGWIKDVAASRPLLPFKLGLVNQPPSSQIASELSGAARSVLVKAGYFDSTSTTRAHLDINVRVLDANAAEVEYVARTGPPMGGGKVLYRKVIRTATNNQSISQENTTVRLLAGNLKLFVIDLRNQFDPAFAKAAAELIADTNDEVDSRGIMSHVGEGAMNTLVATVEGTAATFEVMGEVVASEEFHQGLAQVAGEYQAQQAYQAEQSVRMAQLQAAAARERDAQVAAQQAVARQRKAEQQAQYAAQVAAAQQQANNQQAARQAAAAQRRAEAEARAARQAAEREARIARQQSEARANAAYQMRTFVASSAAATPTQPRRPAGGMGVAQVSADERPVASKPPGKQARAWCMLKRNGEFWCNGPLQNGGWGKTLARALEMVDCPNGQGYTPTVGHGGSSFNCGRELRPTEQEVPLYDPFYNRDKKY